MPPKTAETPSAASPSTEAKIKAAPKIGTTSFNLPVIYRLFFLIVEPLVALLSSFYALFRQHDYLVASHAASAPAAAADIPLATSISLTQLGNLYFLFMLNEALVLRSTGDMRVWKTLLAGLLVADFGHLYSVLPMGWQIYWRVDQWAVQDWGNVAFVYVAISIRLAFFLGVGIRRPVPGVQKKD